MKRKLIITFFALVVPPFIVAGDFLCVTVRPRGFLWLGRLENTKFTQHAWV
jgi:hypothetical protein